MSICGVIDLPGALLIALLSVATGRALARPVEKMVAHRLPIPAWQ